ncbi:DUF2378 family protein [Stigmatella aurantiaca]|uniref:Conserved uncharacterized protein n=1 Tax=Stigmatella aurantiaca (strain DW4/3-1) TaxID=378806 RepID=Q099B7_STIAD|nr:DUF2378 family protein [Stigmatella aurantiaca]ADO75566.1 conserved uncharacterized protein [Stigmatella aurantiaca DW4/3-1]EAU68342.1 hypothetical protein STIAU_3947 [Stigmatella aurantiaca DW4/3-1]
MGVEAAVQVVVQTQDVRTGVPLNTERHLEHNITLSTPEDTARGMFFTGTLEAVRKLAGEELARRCREATGERKHVDFFSYPVASFLRLCLAAAAHVGPQLGGCEETLRWIGEQSSRDFLSSMAGKTMLLLAGGSMKRILGQLPSSYRAAVSYGERTLTCTQVGSGGTGRFVIKNDFLPHAYHEGILRGLLLEAGAQTAQVQGRATGALDSAYDFSWH